MMNDTNHIERILNSLDGMSRAEANPFLYTRIMARMEKEEKNLWSRISDVLAKPMVAIASLVVVLGINVYFITNRSGQSISTDTSAVSISENQQVDNYTLAVNNNYILTNLEQ
ncbi:MAG: hypothetical protein QM727_04810 [Niabella sp.]